MTKINLTEDLQNQPDEKLQKLKAIFPNFFDIDGNFIASELANFVSNFQEKPDLERFTFNFAGKQKAKETAHKSYIDGTLKFDEKRSQNFDQTKNLIIEGDNLQALKLLSKSYRNKVKCIYIDPPYNTGNDFVYNDKFELDIKKYLIETGEKDEETGEQLAEYIEKADGKKHSKWLSFMYPRLFVARELLKDDGVIFISIDDNEVANLKLLMNELFGEENFVAQLVWRKTDNQANIGNMARVKEYILCYVKDESCLQFNKMNLTERAKKEYRYSDQNGFFRRAILLDKTRGRNVYDIKTPSGKILSGPWMIKEDQLISLNNQNKIYWTKSGDEQPYGKIYLEESGGQIASDLLGIEFGTNQEGSLEVEDLFKNRLFDFPKPVSLIKHFLTISTSPSDIVLDFFAGSGTTGQEVMELNQEEISKQQKSKADLLNQEKEEENLVGNRRFILVQLPEKIDAKKEAFKAGYSKISDITIERIKRASKKYPDIDNGFKVLKLQENPDSNTLFSLGNLDDNGFILTHLALFYGYGLNYQTQKISDSKEIYLIKSEFEKTRPAIVILEKNLLQKADIMGMVYKFCPKDCKNKGRNYEISQNGYKFFSRDKALDVDLTYNLLQHFEEESVVVF